MGWVRSEFDSPHPDEVLVAIDGMNQYGMKKIFYITCFTFLGYLLQQLLHSVLEISYISLLTSNFERYSLGFSWSAWYWIHAVLTVLFVLAGISGGFWQGKYWWNRLYNEDGSRKK